MSSNAIAMKWSLFSKIKEEETTHQDKRPSSLKQEQHMAYTIKPQTYKKKKGWHFISFFLLRKKSWHFKEEDRQYPHFACLPCSVLFGLSLASNVVVWLC